MKVDKGTDWRSIDYLDYLSMPREQRKHLPTPTLLLRWVDLDEMRKIKGHSWYSKLTGKLSLGILTIVATKPDQPFSQDHADKLALELLRLRPSSHTDYRRTLSRRIQSSQVYRPFLVLSEGMMRVQMYAPELIRILYRILATRIPKDQLPAVNWEELKYDEDTQERVRGTLLSLASVLPSAELVSKLLIDRIREEGAFRRTAPGGREFYEAILVGKGSLQEEAVVGVLLSDGALKAVQIDLLLKGLPVRLLGWVVHVRDDLFMVRAVAFAEIRLFTRGP